MDAVSFGVEIKTFEKLPKLQILNLVIFHHHFRALVVYKYNTSSQIVKVYDG